MITINDLIHVLQRAEASREQEALEENTQLLGRHKAGDLGHRMCWDPLN